MKTLDDEFPSDPAEYIYFILFFQFSMFLIENNKDLGVEDFSD